jgi:hypothetical protein
MRLAGLVDEVDGLVRQLAVRDVALRQAGRGDDRRVGDIHAVVNLVALLEAAQDGDRVLLAGLVDQHLLEATLQRRVLLDVLAVLVRVVAPTQCSSPRARAGLSMLPASMEPSALPAPTMVWISSMNRITRPLPWTVR